MKAPISVVAGVACAFALGGCVGLLGIDEERPLRDGGAGDASRDSADAGDVSVLDACDTRQPFGPLEELLPDPQLSRANGRISPDGLELYLAQWKGTSLKLLHRSVRPTVNDPWGPPALVAELNEGPDGGVAEVNYAALTGDGLTAYLQYYDGKTPGRANLYSSKRASTSAPWSKPAEVPLVNSGEADDAPWVSSDGNRLWFFKGGTYRIFMAERVGELFGPPMQLPDLLPTDDRTPVLTDDELTLYFSGPLVLADDAGAGMLSVHRATRKSKAEPFANPEPVPELNVTYTRTWPSWISKDGCSIIVTREIGPAQLLWATKGR